MTKKDFELIAWAIAQAEPTNTEHELSTCADGWAKTASAIANALQSTHPKFDRKKFLQKALKIEL